MDGFEPSLATLLRKHGRDREGAVRTDIQHVKVGFGEARTPASRYTPGRPAIRRVFFLRVDAGNGQRQRRGWAVRRAPGSPSCHAATDEAGNAHARLVMDSRSAFGGAGRPRLPRPRGSRPRCAESERAAPGQTASVTAHATARIPPVLHAPSETSSRGLLKRCQQLFELCLDRPQWSSWGPRPSRRRSRPASRLSRRAVDRTAWPALGHGTAEARGLARRVDCRDGETVNHPRGDTRR